MLRVVAQLSLHFWKFGVNFVIRADNCADRKPAGSYPGRPRQPEFPLAPGRPWWLAIAELLASPPPGFLGAEVP